ncbi:MAG: F0F1 ATP synthase subunit B [Arsenophonus sp. ET-KM2-MAG3]
MNINATIIGQAISFFFFVLFCMKYIWPHIMAVIEKRQKEIADNLSSAEQVKKNSELIKASAEEQLKKAKTKAQIIIEQANKQRVQMIKDAKIEAESERKRIVTKAQIEIDVMFKRSREELRKQVAMLVILGAEKIIERSINIAANNDIIDKLIKEL